MRKFGLALLALAASMPAMAAPSGEPGAKDGEKRVCRPAAAHLGSRIKRPKSCRTAAEWEELERARRGPAIPVRAAQPEPWERTRPQ